VTTYDLETLVREENPNEPMEWSHSDGAARLTFLCCDRPERVWESIAGAGWQVAISFADFRTWIVAQPTSFPGV
jgi:hypothetical protein